MTEQLATNQVSLDDLKRAIACYTAVDGDAWAKEAGGSDYASRRWHALSFAWRTAFEWREGWYAKVLAVMHRASGDISIIEEGAEGMRLIAEKLR